MRAAVILIPLLLFISVPSLSQPNERVAKLALYPHFSNPGVTVGFELEKSFIQTVKFTQAFRIEYRTISGDAADGFYGHQNLSLGYVVKCYPFAKRTSKKFQGVFFGIMPCYFVKVRDEYRYGPAIGIPIGYQLVLKSRLTLSLEYTPTYLQNVNDGIPPGNSQDLYFDLFKAFRVGYRF